MNATVYGYVQGVSFRYYAQRQANRLRLTGWVANQADGTVQVVAEGEDEALQHMEAWLHQGSPAAQVERVESEWVEASGSFFRFEIRFVM